MRLFVGLGNPGKEYELNKHNVGFMILDEYANKMHVRWSVEKKLLGWMARVEDTILIKPSTFMNSSGDCVSKVLSFFKIELNDLVVIHDDVDLEFGKTVLRKGSSSAGHHGIQDIIQKIGSQDFWRYRVGVGRPPEGEFDVTDWVLSDLSKEQIVQIKNIPFPIS